MKIQGCCLRTVEEQIQGGDDKPVDPNTIEIPTYVPILVNYERGIQLAGGVVTLHEGRLWFDGSIPDDWPCMLFLAIEYTTDGTKYVLSAVSIVEKPVDQGTWIFNVIE